MRFRLGVTCFRRLVNGDPLLSLRWRFWKPNKDLLDLLLSVYRCQLTTILDLCFLLVLSVGDRGEWCVRLRLAQYLGDIHVELVTILSLDCKQLTKGRCCFLSSMNSYFIFFFTRFHPHPTLTLVNIGIWQFCYQI